MYYDNVYIYIVLPLLSTITFFRISSRQEFTPGTYSVCLCGIGINGQVATMTLSGPRLRNTGFCAMSWQLGCETRPVVADFEGWLMIILVRGLEHFFFSIYWEY